MQKKFTENPLLFEILAAYKKSEFSTYLSFYEYCEVNLQFGQMAELNDLVDQLKIEQSMRDNFQAELFEGLDSEDEEF